jgi:hypothetical protein
MHTPRTIRSTTAAAIILGFAASSTLAAPRDTLTLTNVPSDDPGSIALRSVTSAYTVRNIVISATLNGVSPSTRATDAIIHITAPGGEAFTIQPFTWPSFGAGPAGPMVQSKIFFKLPTAVASQGNWKFRFTETINDAGVDARWSTITISLNDGPPANTFDIGTLDAPEMTLNNVGTTRWLKFTLPETASAQAGKYLDLLALQEYPIYAGQDVHIALFAEDGRLVSTDNNGGLGATAAISYGGGNRGYTIAGDGRNGSDGSLKPGTYYLAVAAAPIAFSDGWGASMTSISAAHANIRLYTNTHIHPFAAADHNRDGAVNQIDLNEFMTDYLSGGY